VTKLKRYVVRYERDEDGWWVATVKNIKGVHTQARTMGAAQKRIREALSLAVGHDNWELWPWSQTPSGPSVKRKVKR